MTSIKSRRLALLPLSLLVACSSSNPATSEPDGEVGASASAATIVEAPLQLPWHLRAPETTRLLIVTSRALQPSLVPLVDHKNRTGMPAALVTVDELRAAHGGRDDAEATKRGIAFAQRNLGVQYVMLAGDPTHVPVRHRYVELSGSWADGNYHPADLYYASLYDHPARSYRHGSALDTWDADGDGHFNRLRYSASPSFNPDGVDAFADVAVGRVPAANEAQMRTYVRKVIAYETTPFANKDKFATFIDNEYAYSRELMADVEAALAPRAVTTSHVIMRSMSGQAPSSPYVRGGASDVNRLAAESFFMTYNGHGSRDGWLAEFVKSDVDQMTNTRNLPIVFGAACETGQFSTAIPNGAYLDAAGVAHSFTYTELNGVVTSVRDQVSGATFAPPALLPMPSNYGVAGNPAAVASNWLFHPGGAGSIAYFGDVLVKPNNFSSDVVAGMYRSYAAGASTLGDMWRASQQQYWFRHASDDGIIGAPRIYLSYMTMFGDPSLRIQMAPVEEELGLRFCVGANGEVLTGDFNADGRADLLCHDRASGDRFIAYAKDGARFTGTDWQSRSPFCTGANGEMVTGDFNGDGRSDVLCHDRASGDMFISYATAAGNFDEAHWESDAVFCIGADGEIVGGDFNGDGRDDLACHDKRSGALYVTYADGAGRLHGTNWQLPGQWCVGTSGHLVAGDFDGDGRADLLCHDKTSGDRFIAYASASGRFAGTQWRSPAAWCASANGQLFAGDFNGDGRSDLLCYDRVSGQRFVSYANAKGVFGGSDVAKTNGWCNWSGTQVVVGNFVDQAADVLCHDRSNGKKWVAFSPL